MGKNRQNKVIVQAGVDWMRINLRIATAYLQETRLVDKEIRGRDRERVFAMARERRTHLLTQIADQADRTTTRINGLSNGLIVIQTRMIEGRKINLDAACPPGPSHLIFVPTH